MNKPHETELQYQAIFEQSPYGILLIDSSGNIVEFNEAAHRDLGYTREEFARLHLADIDAFQSQEDIQASISQVLRHGSARFEVKHKTKNGEIRNVSVITRVLNLSGHMFFQTIWNDITEYKRVEEELRRQQEHMEELVKARTAELSMVNQQLQTDIAKRKSDKLIREKLILKLKNALANIKTLKGLLPMCAWCKKVRNDTGYWQKVEIYIREHSDASFTHCICPDCLKKESPETYEDVFKAEKSKGQSEAEK